jgi:phage shock protein C
MKTLTRSTTDSKLTGVAGGLGEYFDVDPILFRVGFAVSALFSGAGLVAYLVLMVLMPKHALTPAVA